MDLSSEIQFVPMIGESYAKKLQKLGIYTLKDLIYHIPFRYEDTSELSHLADLRQSPDGIYTVKVQILEIQNIYTRYGKHLTQAVVEDETGVADVVWFNQAYLKTSLPPGTKVTLSGKMSSLDPIRPKFISPSYEVLTDKPSIHLGKLTPIYPETKGVSSKWLRSRIHQQLARITIEEWLHDSLRKRYNLYALSDAIQTIHFPQTKPESERALHRIAFDEMLLIQLLMHEKRSLQKAQNAKAITSTKQTRQKYIQTLPFTLTRGQEQAMHEILDDLNQSVPMNRLLEGDVGSGKTVVAASALYHAYCAGVKACIMAPTSILAGQHYETFKKIFALFAIPEAQICLVTSRVKPTTQASIFIGTQALLFQKHILEEIDLAVIDEQHRFGVTQREQIVNKQGNVIHSLTMSATPIPRTLALSLYGDIDISYIQELPKGRKEIMTRLVPDTKRDDMYQFIQAQIKAGRQAFIVCPLVSLSDKLNLKSATAEFDHLVQGPFKEYKLVLLHGQMKAAEKDAILADFKNRKYNILVSTPVVEVGIDIPNASVMVIEGAERFGLAQLHQLRGRVGRGEYASYCFLLTTNPTHEEDERLHVFAQNQSGLKIAEFDLQNRGPGEVYGVKQSGIPTLKAASLLDTQLITLTQQAAEEILRVGIKKFPAIYARLTQFKQDISKLN